MILLPVLAGGASYPAKIGGQGGDTTKRAYV
jgi:hypothetical protein